jgi:hypothetical protein
MDVKGLREWCDSVEETFRDSKNIPHQFLEKAISYVRACVDEIDSLNDELGVEPELEPIEVPDNIRKYLRWKESCTDRWGDELLSYLLYHTDKDNGYTHKPDEEHREGWEAIRALPYEIRERMIRQVFGGAVEGGWPPDQGF